MGNKTKSIHEFPGEEVVKVKLLSISREVDLMEVAQSGSEDFLDSMSVSGGLTFYSPAGHLILDIPVSEKAISIEDFNALNNLFKVASDQTEKDDELAITECIPQYKNAMVIYGENNKILNVILFGFECKKVSFNPISTYLISSLNFHLIEEFFEKKGWK